MIGRLDGKVAIITGGASGMGRATALRFLEEGARVVIADINDRMADETLELARAAGSGESIRYLRTDVSSEPDIKALVAFALERFGRLDCMFNNAGASGTRTSIADTTVEGWDGAMALLLRSVFLGVKHAALAMRDQGQGGSIISTSSTASLRGGCGQVAYSAAKAGVANFTMNAAVEFAPDRIRVNAIAPGGILTPLIPAKSEAELLQFMRGRQPWPDAGSPLDIANTALFLASDESRFSTGTTILVDGGLLAWGPGLFPANRSFYDSR